MIYLIDNYDSFTYNLADIVKRYTEVTVVRNDELTTESLIDLRPKALILSPGPGKPEESGISCEAAAYFLDKIPVLGVCLGHQILAQITGSAIVKARKPMHGKTSLIFHQQQGVFKGLKSPLNVMRYHSLLIDPPSLAQSFEIIAQTEEKEIMAIRHKQFPVTGVQFHPESILTEKGNIMIKNWILSIR
ncbi:MAG: aminodeoxychorismate/anthranilate synthase component II [Bacteroidia bacterium]|nr:aminodeoxychorismate/anthranilate synthase component II [Bacteroidia bacterium]